MAEPLAQSRLSVTDYLNWELKQTDKHDYLRGEVFAMTGGTLRHNLGTVACIRLLPLYLLLSAF